MAEMIKSQQYGMSPIMVEEEGKEIKGKFLMYKE